LLEHINNADVEVCVSTHALVELFAVLTRFPQWRVRADTAQAIIEGIRPRVTVIALTEDDYVWVLKHVTSLELVGAVVYDGLHARAALKAGVTTLYTLNTKDFMRLGDAVARLVASP
jgi:predicted nucleic acid-binding protein